MKILLPGAGNAISASVAAAGTYAIGVAAIADFIQGEPIEQVRAIYQNERERDEEDLRAEGVLPPEVA